MARIKTGGQVILFSDPERVHVVARARKHSFVTACGKIISLTPLSRIGNRGTPRCPTCLWCVACHVRVRNGVLTRA